jgi:hypothetical protein
VAATTARQMANLTEQHATAARQTQQEHASEMQAATDYHTTRYHELERAMSSLGREHDLHVQQLEATLRGSTSLREADLMVSLDEARVESRRLAASVSDLEDEMKSVEDMHRVQQEQLAVSSGSLQAELTISRASESELRHTLHQTQVIDLHIYVCIYMYSCFLVSNRVLIFFSFTGLCFSLD